MTTTQHVLRGVAHDGTVRNLGTKYEWQVWADKIARYERDGELVWARVEVHKDGEVVYVAEASDD